jgi:hypothetical protein
MKFQFCLFFIAFFCFKSFAYDGNALSARSEALGNTGVVFRDVNAVFTNQAGLAGVQHVQIGMSAERKFLLNDLQQFSLAVAIPVKSGTFGFSAQRFGFEDFNESKLGIGFGKRLGEKLDIGIQLNYLQQHILEQPNQSAFTVEFGLISNLTKKLKLGFHVFNPIPFSTNYFQKELPSVYTLGIGWQLSKNVLYLAEADENLNFQTNLKSGIEYKLIEQFIARCGIQTNPQAFSAGIGYHTKSFYFDFSNVFHPVLGSTPKVSLTFLFGK